MPLQHLKSGMDSAAGKVVKICFYYWYICIFIYTDVKNNFHMYKNSSASLINATLWHYLGTYNFDFRHENNNTPGY